MKRIVLSFILLACLVSGQANSDWYWSFTSPKTDVRPWTFWYWMYGCVSDEGIRRDLHAMSDAGISGFYLMSIKDVSDGPQYGGTARQLSAEWWKRMDTVFRTADSLNLQVGIHYSDGFALGGGPWITHEESMQKVVWTDTVVTGGRVSMRLSRPKAYKDYYGDIAVYAYPATYADNRMPHSSVEFPYRSSEPCDIIMSYNEPFTLRRVQIVTGGNNYQAHRFKVYASDNGRDYSFIREISPARQGWQNTDAYATYAIPATKAKYFKFHWTPRGSDSGSEDMDAAKWKPNLKIGGLILGSEPVIDGYEGKSGVVWRVSKAFNASNAGECVDMDSVINLTPLLDGDNMEVNLPKGKWHILRMGHTSTGHTNATGGGGRGLECDKFSRAAIDKQFDKWFANIYRHAPQDAVGRVLTRLHVDSWECGSQNWSANFVSEFKARRGYDLMTWLPLFAGVPMQTVAKSDSVLRDVRLTIAELIDGIFFDEVEKLARQYGCKLSCECVAPTMVSDGLLHYKHADYPMGEFWYDSPTHDKLNDMLDAVSGAHIYGKNIVQAEGFTQIRGTWNEHPGMLKALLDRNYCLGINSIVFHVNTHNPYIDRVPGMTLDGIGTFFQRDNVWWREMPAFTAYIARCQSLLQYGSPVVDIAVYTGDETPRRSILPERLVMSLPGLFGEGTVARERIRMENEGQPLEVSPVGVTHTANMTKAEHWVNPLRGYRYDSFNHDVLKGAKVEDGMIVTRGGMRYATLVLPQARPMNPDRLTCCDNLVGSLEARGARVISEPWIADDLSSVDIVRDAVLPEGIDYAHRHGNDADIYFLSNQTDRTVTFAPLFRAVRKCKYIANPMDGAVYVATDTVTLTPHASLFYVFTDKAVGTAANVTVAGKSKTLPLPVPLDCKEWNVTFETTGQSVTSDKLFDWSKSEINGIKYYSGHAVYETTFKVKKLNDYKGGRIMLNLGDVHNIATVYVNGINCGTLWTSPHVADITGAVGKGVNTLKVVVVNTWANALLGNDLGTPPFGGIWTNGKYRRAEKTPLPAGLLGPLTIEAYTTNDNISR